MLNTSIYSRTYPDAELEQLKTIALMSMIFFIFDDTIDKEIEDDTPDFASDFDLATKLRQESIACMRYLFSQDGSKASSNRRAPRVPQEFASIEAFAPRVTAATRGRIDLDKLGDDFQEFIEANAIEQAFRLSGNLPDIKEYWSYRHGVGAVFPYCTMSQYVHNIALPDSLAWCEEVQIMRLETSAQPLM